MSMSEFFAMGGYAFYVWTSYALAFIVLIVNVIIPRYQHRQALQRIEKRAKRKEKLS